MSESTTKLDSAELTTAATIIVGAGAAGMAAAVQLARRRARQGHTPGPSGVLVVTAGRALGASRMSGSDKQTYYKLATDGRSADSAEAFARTLTAGGCCHGDLAFVEGACSLEAFFNLVQLGVEFPHDPTGAYVGYHTDHDPLGRATSCGPRTSQRMAAALEAEARSLGVTIIDNCTVVRFVTAGDGEQRRVVGMVCVDSSAPGDGGSVLRAFAANSWVLAAGGPGSLYAASVYPPGQVGIHGPALLAGLEASNLAEWQFGLASTKFRWNVSGSYMQVIPRIFSTAADGSDPREFLAEIFGDMPTLAGAIFRKGYQWPFDVDRLAPDGSSLIDVAVHRETVDRGRRVWMDFTSNPIGSAGWDEFHLSALDREPMEYLEGTGALGATPLERLAQLNAPAIEIYRDHGIDLASEPLEICVCVQHHNGGFAVDKWWRSNIPNVFVIGEMAGTHGVRRPGGAALNAGQVGAIRSAEFIAANFAADSPDQADARKAIAATLAEAQAQADAMLAAGPDVPTPAQVMAEVGQRMTASAAHLRRAAGTAQAAGDALAQYRRLLKAPPRATTAGDLAAAVQAVQQCLTSAAVLATLAQLLDRDLGSRGSSCVLDDRGVEMQPNLIDAATGEPYRFRKENLALRDEIVTLRCDADESDPFSFRIDKPRPLPSWDEPFETTWRFFRDGEIFG
jgi:succinate dehydrogenase/fumarate reductase flavoprotein subunit